jgi:hypothetical protein
MPLSSNQAGVDYVHGLSRLRPATSPMSPLTPSAARREISSVWAGSMAGKVSGAPPPPEWATYAPGQSMSAVGFRGPGSAGAGRVGGPAMPRSLPRRPPGYVPKTNQPVSPRNTARAVRRAPSPPSHTLHTPACHYLSGRPAICLGLHAGSLSAVLPCSVGGEGQRLRQRSASHSPARTAACAWQSSPRSTRSCGPWGSGVMQATLMLHGRSQVTLDDNDDDADSAAGEARNSGVGAELPFESWTVADVCKWTKAVLNLPQYAGAMRKHKIDGYALLRLTADRNGRDDVLSRLGVEDRVHRSAILAGVRKLEIANARRLQLQANQEIGTINAGGHRHSWKPTIGTHHFPSLAITMWTAVIGTVSGAATLSSLPCQPRRMSNTHTLSAALVARCRHTASRGDAGSISGVL